MKVYIEGTDKKEEKDDTYLPDIVEGELIKAKELTPYQHFTQPPPRYTEATLVGTLEKQGIGRPSTDDSTLDTIKRRGKYALANHRFGHTTIDEIGIVVI